MKTHFLVIARTRSEQRVSRHGISRSQGGQEVAREVFDSTVPFYMACDMMREDHPGCDISVRLIEPAKVTPVTPHNGFWRNE